MGAEYAGMAGRLILGGFFLVAGVANLVTPGSIRDHIDRMRAYGTPAPAVVFWCGIGVQFLGAALVLSGIRADVGAVCLIVFTALATAIFHRFWQRTDPMQQRTSRLFFMSNAAIIGGLLLLVSGAARAHAVADRPPALAECALTTINRSVLIGMGENLSERERAMLRP